MNNTKSIQVLTRFLKTCHLFLEWIKIEGSNVINLDIPATNGVVQVLESVIQVVFRILNRGFCNRLPLAGYIEKTSKRINY